MKKLIKLLLPILLLAGCAVIDEDFVKSYKARMLAQCTYETRHDKAAYRLCLIAKGCGTDGFQCDS